VCETAETGRRAAGDGPVNAEMVSTAAGLALHDRGGLAERPHLRGRSIKIGAPSSVCGADDRN